MRQSFCPFLCASGALAWYCSLCEYASHSYGFGLFPQLEAPSARSVPQLSTRRRGRYWISPVHIPRYDFASVPQRRDLMQRACGQVRVAAVRSSGPLAWWLECCAEGMPHLPFELLHCCHAPVHEKVGHTLLPRPSPSASAIASVSRGTRDWNLWTMLPRKRERAELGSHRF